MSRLLWDLTKSIAFHLFVIVLVSVAVLCVSAVLVGVFNALSVHK